MTIRQQHNKLVAHTSHLLTSFLQLRERYALLHPMLFDERVPKQYGSYKQARGYSVLKSSLFLMCCQDIAKLIADNFDKTPSLKRSVEGLMNADMLAKCKGRYIEDRPIYDGDDEPDTELVEVYKAIHATERENRSKEFDSKYEQLLAAWGALSSSPVSTSFRVVRDKVTAHTELKGDDYKPIDIGTLDIKWGSLKATISEIQTIVELLNNLIRDAGFAWESFDRMVEASSTGFWSDRDSPIPVRELKNA
jgi:hypothetical protein